MNSVLDARGIFRIYIHFRTAAIGGRYVEGRGNSIDMANAIRGANARGKRLKWHECARRPLGDIVEVQRCC